MTNPVIVPHGYNNIGEWSVELVNSIMQEHIVEDHKKANEITLKLAPLFSKGLYPSEIIEQLKRRKAVVKGGH